ncbi:MAG: hydantoinase B/oxoprolinase family protein [Rhodospirillaceae bacterium]|nr:hydantoinase B/oxoprolinase family protein [Rhodospirillaceae bacterium]
MSDVDPITASVIQHRLVAVAEEMGEAMLRTSYSQIMNSSRDFSTAICGPEGRLVSQAEHIPVHVGALPWAVKAVVEFFGDDVHQGDVFLLNDPYHGGSHLPDLTAFVPVFAGDRLIFWTVNRAHHSDIGGATHGAYNATATEIWQEGLRVPPIRLYEKGEIRADLMQLLTINVRLAKDFQGDLAAQIGSVRLGERRLEALMEEFTPDVVVDAVEVILNSAEQQARGVISSWQDGVYHGVAVLDDDGRGNDDIAIRAKVTIEGSDLEIDLSESDYEVTSFVNSSHANMQSGVAMALAFLLDPETPKNDGSFRPVKVVAREGSIVWAKPGAPVTLSTSHCAQEIIEAIVRALAPACPDRAMAGWGRRFRIAIKGDDPRNGQPFIWHMFHARPGAGASSGGDGWHGSGEWHSTGGLKFGSIEIVETRFPLYFRRHEYRANSGGSGRYTGGAGVDLDLEVETATPCKVNAAGDGARHGAAGMLGGEDGAPHRYLLRAPGKRPRVLRTKEEGIEVPVGAVFEIHSAGGGGWGPPGEREQAAKDYDRRNGYTTKSGGKSSKAKA